jgi:hypothetical protein
VVGVLSVTSLDLRHALSVDLFRHHARSLNGHKKPASMSAASRNLRSRGRPGRRSTITRGEGRSLTGERRKAAEASATTGGGSGSRSGATSPSRVSRSTTRRSQTGASNRPCRTSRPTSGQGSRRTTTTSFSRSKSGKLIRLIRS